MVSIILDFKLEIGGYRNILNKVYNIIRFEFSKTLSGNIMIY